MYSRRHFIRRAGSLILALPLRARCQRQANVVVLDVYDDPLASIDAEYIGWSYEKKSMILTRLLSANNRNLIDLWAPLGCGILRIGGNTVEQFVWNPNGRGGTSGEVAPPDVDALANFARATNRRILYAVNAAGATSAAHAAEEVAYVRSALGNLLFGVEIGNESNDYAQKYDKLKTVSDYATLWRDFRTAILQQSPGVFLTGPATSTASKVDEWTIPFQEKVQHLNSVITQHYYRGKGSLPDATAERLISHDDQLFNAGKKLQAESLRTGTPWRLTETNSYWAGGSPGVSNSYAATLWSIDHIFSSALYGCSGVNFHCGNRTLYSAITDDDGRVTGIHPLYYGLWLAARFGSGTLIRTRLGQIEGRNVSCYAVRRHDGSIAVLINNKTSETFTLRLTLPTAVSSAHSFGLTGPALKAKDGITIQNRSLNPSGSNSEIEPTEVPLQGKRASVVIPPLSAVMIETA